MKLSIALFIFHEREKVIQGEKPADDAIGEYFATIYDYRGRMGDALYTYHLSEACGLAGEVDDMTCRMLYALGKAMIIGVDDTPEEILEFSNKALQVQQRCTSEARSGIERIKHEARRNC